MGQNNKPNTALEALDLLQPRFNLAKVSAQPIFFLFFCLMTFGTQPPRDFWECIIMALESYLCIVDGT
jgi:hypothetical protein